MIITKRKFLPTLYKLNANGKIQVWKISVEPARRKKNAIIQIDFGVKDGAIRKHAECIDEGKNIGKKNETTPHQQAVAEAKARWVKQLKDGYSKTFKGALVGATDKLIKGGELPMLANLFQDVDVSYPAYYQRKLDGMRCIAVKVGNKITLWSRKRRQILSCPHIIKQLEDMTKGVSTFFLDGELYKHGEDFEKIISAVRKNKPSKESAKVEFHIYDMEFTNESRGKFSFAKRLKSLTHFPDWYTHVLFVDTYRVENKKDVDKLYKQFMEEGYEGGIFRTMEGKYKGKRTNDLLKHKVMLDKEFIIYDFVAGKDKTVIAVCKIPKQKVTFKATMDGDKKKNQKYLKNKKKYIGKKLTVQFQRYTKKNNVPLFPVGLRIRGEE